MPLLSVIIPVYNEAKTIKEILGKINSVGIDKEIIIVDDSSTDGTDKVLRDIRYNNLKVIHHSSNRGKGAAFLTGLSNASGDFIIVQDADLEYEPSDYLKLMEALKENNADLALGARFIKGHQGIFWHRLGNKFLTRILNFLFNSKLNDYATCYKLAAKNTWDNLGLKASRFDIDVEVVCKSLKRRLRVIEIPISYYPRRYCEGKKIRWFDGLQALISILKYRFME